MKRFELLGRLVFDAEDIADAYQKLADHFAFLALGQDSPVELAGSHVKVRPVALSGGFLAVEAPTARTLLLTCASTGSVLGKRSFSVSGELFTIRQRCELEEGHVGKHRAHVPEGYVEAGEEFVW